MKGIKKQISKNNEVEERDEIEKPIRVQGVEKKNIPSLEFGPHH